MAEPRSSITLDGDDKKPPFRESYSIPPIDDNDESEESRELNRAMYELSAYTYKPKKTVTTKPLAPIHNATPFKLTSADDGGGGGGIIDGIVDSFAKLAIERKNRSVARKLNLSDTDDDNATKEEEEAKPIIIHKKAPIVAILEKEPIIMKKKAVVQEKEAVIIEKEPIAAVVQQEVSEICISITGDFPNYDHKELSRLIVDRGLKYSKIVTKETTYLVSALPFNMESQKMQLATKYDIPVKKPEYLAKLLGVSTL